MGREGVRIGRPSEVQVLDIMESSKRKLRAIRLFSNELPSPCEKWGGRGGKAQRFKLQEIGGAPGNGETDSP
jgi:hypothetical protein